LNAVEREPVETRVLNSIASEASYKLKQRSYRKTNLKKKFWRPIVPSPKCPVPKCPAPKRTDPIFKAAGEWIRYPYSFPIFHGIEQAVVESNLFAEGLL